MEGIKRDCKFYDWGGTTPRAYGAYCKRVGSYFQEYENKFLPYCPNCECYIEGEDIGPIFKVDWCGVIHNFQESVHRVLSSIYPNSVKNEEVNTENYNIYDNYKPTKEILDNWIYRDHYIDIFKYGVIYDGAKEFLEELGKFGTIMIRTHQPNHYISHCIHEFLVDGDIPFDEFFPSTQRISKNHIPGILIDDKPENVKCQNPSILIDREYNRDIRHTNRARSYDEALELIKSII